MIEDTPAQYKIRVHDQSEKTLQRVVRAAQSVGITCETVQLEHEHHRAIIDIAEAKRCDLIVMASHGRHGVSAIVLGSETVKVLLTHCKVLIDGRFTVLRWQKGSFLLQ